MRLGFHLALLTLALLLRSAHGAECAGCELSSCDEQRQVCMMGACACQRPYRGPECALERAKLVVFITALRYSAAELHGFAGADTECQRSAPLPLRGKAIFRAWITDGSTERELQFNHSDYDHVSLSGDLVSRSGWPPALLLTSINGTNATAEFWVGGPGACGNWSVDPGFAANGTAVYGSDFEQTGNWSITGRANCTSQFSLLCVQQEHYGGPCESGPCQYNATCLTNFSNETYTCLCPAGRTGVNCQTEVNECASAPCQNGAVCLDQVDGFHCVCPPGISGALCQTDVDECAELPSRCGNGTCENSFGGFACHCNAGWSGADCRTNIDECASSPCRNGGTCSDGYNGYTCVCALGFSGRSCSLNINECASNPCPYHANCIDLVAGYRCDCGGGYSGPQCQNFTDPCLSSPCQNGGTCSSGDALGPAPWVNYSCSCTAYHDGVNCEHVSQCLYAPCQNSGSCTSTSSAPGYECACVLKATNGYSGVNCTDCVAPWGSTCGGDTCLSFGQPTSCGGCGVSCATDQICTWSDGLGSFHCALDVCANNACHGGTCTPVPNGEQPFTCDCGVLYATGPDCGTCFPGFSAMCPGWTQCTPLSSSTDCGACGVTCLAPKECMVGASSYECR